MPEGKRLLFFQLQKNRRKSKVYIDWSNFGQFGYLDQRVRGLRKTN